MTFSVVFAFVILLTATASAQNKLPVGQIAVTPSASILEIDIDRMKGQPSKLAWSPDGRELYLELLEGPFGKGGRTRHLVIGVADGKQKTVDAVPAWAVASWNRKSGQLSPDDPAFRIGVETSQRQERMASAPMGGDMARGAPGAGGDIGGGAGGTSSGEAIAAAANQQLVTVNAMKLAGETIGEFVNSVIVPGYTFGWGPAGSRIIVFAKPKGGELVVMDSAKKKQEIDGTKDAVLPAFSEDGTKLAWLKRDGRGRFSLHVANVSAR